ncbi:MAG: hypothetical protein AAF215_27185 [Cyanobacteria bacterium P01_A01_bin.123]
MQYLSNRDRADTAARIQVEGDAVLVQRVENLLAITSGMYGHIVGEEASPVDLNVAMRSPRFAAFNPELLEGEELTFPAENQFPEGARS